MRTLSWDRIVEESQLPTDKRMFSSGKLGGPVPKPVPQTLHMFIPTPTPFCPDVGTGSLQPIPAVGNRQARGWRGGA